MNDLLYYSVLPVEVDTALLNEQPTDWSLESCWLLGHTSRLAAALREQECPAIRSRLLEQLLRVESRFPHWDSLPRLQAEFQRNTLWQEFQREQVTIVTDVEPDDMIALLLLKRMGHLRQASIVVSGWSNLGGKAQWLVRALGLSTNQVYTGIQSKCDFSYGLAQTTAFKQWYPGLFESAFVLCLAPPLELAQVKPTLLQRSTLAIYGGFNLRDPKHQSLTKHFQRVLEYQAKLAVANPHVHDQELLSLLPSAIKDSIVMWNAHIVGEIAQLYDSISKCPGQFVNADTGLVTTLIGDTKQWKLEGNVVHGLPGLEQEQLQWMKRILRVYTP